MTRQESPSTLLHYGDHWWPLDRQPNTIYCTTNTNTTLPPPRSQLHPNSGPAKAGSNTSSYSAPGASCRQPGTTEPLPWNLDLCPSRNPFICNWSHSSEIKYIYYYLFLWWFMVLISNNYNQCCIALLDHSHHPPAIAEHATGHTCTHVYWDTIYTTAFLFDIFIWLTHFSISSPVPQCVFNCRKSMCAAITVKPIGFISSLF